MTRSFKIFLFFFLASSSLFSQPILKLFPTINSMGVEVILPKTYDTDSNAKMTMRYKAPGQAYKTGFEATRITLDTIKEFRTSMFMLDANTKYVVEVTVTDSFPALKKDISIDSINTLSEPVIVAGGSIKYVSPTGTGTLYTSANPGNIKTLFASGLSCGTTVILRGGTYDIGDMTLNLNQNCTEGTPIVIMAAPGEIPILDGGDHQQYTWTKTTSDPDMYYTTIRSDLEYNALCMIDNARLYPYAFINPNGTFPGYPSLADLGYDASGFYRKGSLVYIKTLDHKDPNTSTVTFSKYFYCLSINGNGKNNFLYFKGITFNFYGKGKCDKDIFSNPTTCYPSFTMSFNGANHVIIDSCKFNYSNFPVSFNGVCNSNIVQNSEINDQTGLWSHGAFKQTRDASILEYGSYGRYLENSGIFFSPGNDVVISGNIIRNNKITGVVAGVGLGFGQTFKMTEFDIYNNKVSYCYDGIDPTAACVNTRVWANDISHGPVSISLIPPTYGPVYIFRNVIHHISDRKNHNNDVFFADCDNTISKKIWGTGLKLNAGTPNNIPGYIYLFHNDFHSTDSLGFNLYLWSHTWRGLISKNNIFYSGAKSNIFFDGIKDDSLFSFDSENDAYFNFRNNTIAIIQPVNGISICNNYTSTAAFDAGLKSVTKSQLVRVNGFVFDPLFTDEPNSNFNLKSASQAIDKGVLIPGLNDYYTGSAPDIGAFESGSSNGVNQNRTSHQFQAFPNPYSGTFTIIATQEISLIEIYSVEGKLLQSVKGDREKEMNIQTSPGSGFRIIKIYFVDGSSSAIKLIQLEN